MSKEKYREQYLDIHSFKEATQNQPIIATETELGKATEALVEDEEPAPEQVRSTNHTVIRDVIEVESVFDNNDIVNSEVKEPRGKTNEEIMPPGLPVKDKNSYLVLGGSQKAKLLEHLGENVGVVGRIGGHYEGKAINEAPYVFVNIGRFPQHTFTIVLWSENLLQLQEIGVEPSNLIGKYVLVFGFLKIRHSEYRGEIELRPQIELQTPAHLQILTGEDEAMAILEYRIPITKYIIEPSKSTPPTDFTDNFTENGGVIILPPPPPPVTPPPELYPNSPKEKDSSGKKDSGCAMVIIGAIIGMLILGALTEGRWAYIGLIIGGWVGYVISE